MANSEDQPASAVQQYIEAFNRGDARAMAAMCADPMSILDGMATMTFKLKGKQVTQAGALFTVALRKLPTGWRLASRAWTKGTASVSQNTFTDV
jgi:hypothetical protein